MSGVRRPRRGIRHPPAADLAAPAAGGAAYGRGKTYTWANLLTGTMHAGEDLAQWLVRMQGHGAVPGGPGGSPADLDVWGGKHPMAHKDSDGQGRKPIGDPLNTVQIKKVSLLGHWITHHGINTWAGFDQAVRNLLGPVSWRRHGRPRSVRHPVLAATGWEFGN